MSSSATSLRTERKAATSSRLSAVCRRLTAERGLSGFTIEEVCAEVGVSRRTFFNYFPSKEEAVLGVDEADEEARFAVEFNARGSRGWPAVVDDLVDLAVDHARSAGFGYAEHAEFAAALTREPRLMVRFMGQTREREQALIELVAAREGVSADDLHAAAAVQVVFGALKQAGELILSGKGAPTADDFEAALHDCIASVRAVLAPPTPREDTL